MDRDYIIDGLIVYFELPVLPVSDVRFRAGELPVALAEYLASPSDARVSRCIPFIMNKLSSEDLLDIHQRLKTSNMGLQRFCYYCEISHRMLLNLQKDAPVHDFYNTLKDTYNIFSSSVPLLPGIDCSIPPTLVAGRWKITGEPLVDGYYEIFKQVEFRKTALTL